MEDQPKLPPSLPSPPIAPQDTLRGQQRAFHDALGELDEALARMYLGALLGLRQTENPDRLALAAHGMRELMEKLARHDNNAEGGSQPGATNMMQQARTLDADWSAAERRSRCHQSGRWEGEIDDPLRKGLAAVKRFLDWVDANRPARRRQTAQVLRRFDPSGQPLPTAIERLRIDEWEVIHGYFQGVAHHNENSRPEEFDQWLAVAERFLLDRLRPRTFEDQEALDQIIREGEGGAQQ